MRPDGYFKIWTCLFQPNPDARFSLWCVSDILKRAWSINSRNLSIMLARADVLESAPLRWKKGANNCFASSARETAVITEADLQMQPWSFLSFLRSRRLLLWHSLPCPCNHRSKLCPAPSNRRPLDWAPHSVLTRCPRVPSRGRNRGIVNGAAH